VPTYEGRLELTWTNKPLRLLAHDVKSKRDAARRWANYVSGDEKVGTRCATCWCPRPTSRTRRARGRHSRGWEARRGARHVPRRCCDRATGRRPTAHREGDYPGGTPARIAGNQREDAR
jgi:hypothetical protein